MHEVKRLKNKKLLGTALPFRCSPSSTSHQRTPRHISFCPTPIKTSLVRRKYSWCLVKENFASGIRIPCYGGCSLLLLPGLPTGVRWGIALSQGTDVHITTFSDKWGKIKATVAFLGFQSWAKSQLMTNWVPCSSQIVQFVPRKFDEL